MSQTYQAETGKDRPKLSQEEIEKIRELVPDRFKRVFFIKGVDWDSIYSDPLYALATLGEETEENIQAFPFCMPSSNFDVARLSKFQRLLDHLGIKYGKRDVYLAFSTKAELDDAILAAYLADWEHKWAFEEYMLKEGLFDSMPILKRLRTIEGRE